MYQALGVRLLRKWRAGETKNGKGLECEEENSLPKERYVRPFVTHPEATLFTQGSL